MKPNIHPEYVEATVACACGNTWTTRSTRASLRTDLCSKCHPFYTGEQRIVDSAGQVERFNRRFGRRQEQPAPSSPPSPVETPQQERPTLAEIGDQLPAEEPAAATVASPAADSAQANAPVGEGLARQLEPEAATSRS